MSASEQRKVLILISSGTLAMAFSMGASFFFDISDVAYGAGMGIGIGLVLLAIILIRRRMIEEKVTK